MTPRFQYDFIDGQFADNATVNFADLAVPTDAQIDLDLMVSRPSQWTEAVIARRPHLAVFHLECDEDPAASLAKIKAAGIKTGLAINPATPIEHLQPFVPHLDHVLIMGVAAGYAGQAFEPSVLSKIEQVKIIAPLAEIGVDGGVNLEDIAAIATAGADIAYVNSVLFGAADPVAQYHALTQKLNPTLIQTAA